MKGDPVIVGLLGGIASGKSTVAGFLRELGAKVVDADRIAHEVLRRPDVRDRVVAALGDGVLGADGGLSRTRIGEIVFRDEAALERLEAIVHPAVRERIDLEIAAAEERIVVLDAPLILEGELSERTDVLVYVSAPLAERRSRAAERHGWMDAEHELRESRQASLEEKRRRAAMVIENGGSIEELKRRVEALHREILDRRMEDEG